MRTQGNLDYICTIYVCNDETNVNSPILMTIHGLYAVEFFDIRLMYIDQRAEIYDRP